MNKTLVPGAIFKVPFDDEFHTYARVSIVDRSFIAVYDCKTVSDMNDLNEIIAKPILFFVSVFKYFTQQSQTNNHLRCLQLRIFIAITILKSLAFYWM